MFMYGMYIEDCNMDNSYGGWPMKGAFDDTYCMRSSNDTYRDSVVDLTTLGVVDLDTSIVPDVFGLQAFDSWEPVVRVLPGDFPNTATPIGFSA